MPDDASLAVHWRLAGRLAEYHELLDTLAERPGLTVLVGDPWSGTSVVLNAVASHLTGAAVLVDARSSRDAIDLATTIAHRAVRAFAKQAAAWWVGEAPAPSAAGLRLARALNAKGIDFEALRTGTGEPSRCLEDALELAVALADGPLTLMIDNLGLLLRSLPAGESRALLSSIRILRQRRREPDLVLVEHPGGMLAAALTDRGHPLYRAGGQVRLTRPKPYRFADDLEASGAVLDAELETLPAAAELAAGVPALAWRVVQLADGGETPAERARDGWGRLRSATLPSVARTWDLLRRVHPQAQAVAAAMAAGLGPHAVEANSKSVNDALSRMRDLGMAWQPAARSWSLADPLLAAWIRDFPPAWLQRRRALP